MRVIASLMGAGTYTHITKHMWLSADWTLWLLTILVKAFVVYLFAIRGLFRKFLLFNCYLLVSVTSGISRYVFVSVFGIARDEYAYFYYFTDALVTLFLFLSICELATHIVGNKMPRKIVVLSSAAALLVAAWSSFAAHSSDGLRFTINIATELSQNIFFVCSLGIALLWVWKLRNKPDDWIAGQFVNVLSIYFLVVFLLWCEVNQRTSNFSASKNVWLMVNAWLPLGCGFTLASYEHTRKTIKSD